MKEKIKTFLKNKKIFKIFFICLVGFLFLSNLFLTIFLIKFTGLQSCLSFDKENAIECKIIKRMITKTDLFKIIMNIDSSINDINSSIDDIKEEIDDLEQKINY